MSDQSFMERFGPRLLEAAGFAIRSEIIWAKERLVLSRGDYHWQHEPCLYAVRKGGKAHWAGDRKQTTLWRSHPAIRMPRRSMAPRSRWSACGDRSSTTAPSGRRSTSHFWGSGTTLIAAETTGRVCLGIELNPTYVDVALERWQRFTGNAAVLEYSGKRFDAVREERSSGVSDS